MITGKRGADRVPWGCAMSICVMWLTKRIYKIFDFRFAILDLRMTCRLGCAESVWNAGHVGVGFMAPLLRQIRGGHRWVKDGCVSELPGP